MAGSSWPGLVAGARARASDVEAKFDWLEGNIVPMTGGVTTDAAYDIGTSAARWRDGYFSTSMRIGSALSVTTAMFQVGGDIHVGGADRRIRNVSANALIFGANATDYLQIDPGGTTTAIGQLRAATGASINEFSSDGTLAGNSDLAVPTERAVKTYIDTVARSCCEAYFNSATSVTIYIAGDTKIPFNIETIDTGLEYDNVTNFRFTAANSGVFSVAGNISLATPGAGTGYIVKIYKNGSDTSEFIQWASANAVTTFPFLDAFSLTASDYIEIFMRTSTGATGGSLEPANTGRRSTLVIHRIS